MVGGSEGDRVTCMQSIFYLYRKIDTRRQIGSMEYGGNTEIYACAEIAYGEKKTRGGKERREKKERGSIEID